MIMPKVRHHHDHVILFTVCMNGIT